MILDISTPFPSLEPNTLYSFSPYPLSPRRHLNHVLLHPPSDQPQPQPQAGPSTSSLRGVNYCKERDEINKLMRRAERRALMGKNPAGMMLGREDEEVAIEEDVLEHEQVCCWIWYCERYVLNRVKDERKHVWPSVPITLRETADTDGNGLCPRM